MKILISAFIIFGSTYSNAFELSLDLVAPSCPFIQEDEYSFTSLQNLISTQLQIKEQTRRQCLGPFNNLIQDLNTIQSLYDFEQNPSLRQEIELEVYGNVIKDLEADKLQLEVSYSPEELSNNSEYLELTTQIQIIREDLITAEVDKIYYRALNDDQRNVQLRTQALGHLNNTFSTLANMDADCVKAIGGWGVVLPTILSTAGLASGFSGIGNPSLTGAALQTFANINLLFQDRDLRVAIHELEDVRTQKVLACTYHAIKNSACEYERASLLSEDLVAIRDIIKKRYSSEETKDYELLFYYQSRMSQVTEIFTTLGDMGSAFTFDLNLIFRYIGAKKVNPESIDVTIPINLEDQIPSNDPTDTEMNRWLQEVSRQGISYNTQANGRRLSLKEQVAQAYEDIKQRIENINTAEEILIETRSFVDLRHEIIRQQPDQYMFIKSFRAFLEDVKDLPDFENVEIINAIVNMLFHLEAFLSLEQGNRPYIDYVKDVNKSGAEMFNALAEGTVGQLSSQTVLFVAPNALERFDRAYEVIEQHFLAQDFKKLNDESHPSFADYKNDYSLMMSVKENLESFVGTGKTFRLEDIEVARESFTVGFQEDIKEMLENAISSSSSIVTRHNGVTAQHLCALFNDLIFHPNSRVRRNYASRSTQRWCRENTNSLELVPLFEPKQMTVDLGDACFYSKYIRKETQQRIRLERWQTLDIDYEDVARGPGQMMSILQCTDSEILAGCYTAYDTGNCSCPTPNTEPSSVPFNEPMNTPASL